MSKLNVGVVLGILLFTGMAWSNPILVNNFSFETPVLNAGNSTVAAGFGLSTLTITGWTITGANAVGGTYAPTTVANPNNYFANASGAGHVATNSGGVVPSSDGGAQVAYLRDGTTMFQDLTQVLGGPWGYSLTVDVGHRNEFTTPIGYSLFLQAWNGTTATTLATLSGSLSGIDNGFWAERTLLFAGSQSAFAGQTLRVAFSASGGINQVQFDNVHVDVVPEIGGSAVFWTMFGVAGLFIYGKKRLAA